MRAGKFVWVHRMQRMGKTGRLSISLLAGATLLFVAWGNARAADNEASPAAVHSSTQARDRVNAVMASGPLRFEENVGQIQGPEARDVRYVSRGSAYTLFLTSREAVLVLKNRVEGKDAGKAPPVVVRMRLSGGNHAWDLAGLDELPSKSNYFIGNDPSQWHTDIANYGRVAAKGVYPGIDLVYHGNQGQLEYDFEVAPQADPEKIRFALEGAQRLRIDSQGDLLVKVEGGELVFRRPVAYQRADGAKHFVPVHYAVKGKNQVEFRLAPYDTRQPLVIDPILSYSTYLGGSSIDVRQWHCGGAAMARRSLPAGLFPRISPRRMPCSRTTVGLTTFPRMLLSPKSARTVPPWCTPPIWAVKTRTWRMPLPWMLRARLL